LLGEANVGDADLQNGPGRVVRLAEYRRREAIPLRGHGGEETDLVSEEVAGSGMGHTRT
jgi:hypothetical protein